MTSEASLPAGIEYKNALIFSCTYCDKEFSRGNIQDHVNGKKHDRRKKIHDARRAREAAQIIDVDDDDANATGDADGSSTHMMDVQIDKDALLKSILDGPDEDVEEVTDAGDDVEMSHDGTTDRIRAAFAPIEFKPADGVDNFFDSMPEEAARTEVSKEIRNILETSTPKKNVRPADASTPSKMSLTMNAEGGRDTVASSRNAPEDPNTMPPWIIGADSSNAIRYGNNYAISLHYEILELVRFLSPTDEERAMREKTATTLQNIVKTLWPACRIETFGSYSTGLYLPSSDIDVCVMGSPKEGTEEEMEELAHAVRSVKGFARKVHVIRARVGLVKIVSRDGNVQCDISFGRSNGPRNVPIILKYIEDYPALRPVLLVIKYFLQQRSLNEVYTGGLGSYAVLLLVVSHLQMLQNNFPGIGANLGDILMQFFYLYGRLYNFCIVGIQVGSLKYCNKVERYDTKPGETMRFSIEDPNEVDNEIGNNSFAAGRVRKAFGNAFILLNQWNRENRSHPITPLSRIIAPDRSFKTRRDTVFEYLRKDGTTEMRKYIEKHRKKEPSNERVPNRIQDPNNLGNGNGYNRHNPQHHPRHGYHDNRGNHGNGRGHGSGNHYYDGAKRRRTNNNNHPNSRNYQVNDGGGGVFTARYNGPRTNPHQYGHGHTGNALVYEDSGRDMSSRMAERLGNRNGNRGNSGHINRNNSNNNNSHHHGNRSNNRRGRGGGRRN